MLRQCALADVYVVNILFIVFNVKTDFKIAVFRASVLNGPREQDKVINGSR